MLKHFLKAPLKQHAMVALLLVSLVAAGYAPIVNLSFLSDDWAVIRLVTLPDAVTNWSRNLNDFYTPLFDRSSKYRPLYSMSFALDFWLYGTNSVGYHLTNIALHVFSSFFVYLLALELVPGERRREISITAGALFALYPVHPEAVTWIAGRVDLIAAVFYLPAVIFFLRWLRTDARLYLALSLATFILSLLGKEMAIALPGLLFLLALYRGKGLGGAVARTIPFAIILGVYLAFRAYVLSSTDSGSLMDKEFDALLILQGFIYRTLHMFIPINLGLLPTGWRPLIQPVFFFWPIPVGLALAVAYYRGWISGRLPALLFAFYCVALIPAAIGLSPDPLLKSSRWSYIPSVFLSIFIAYAIWSALARHVRWASLASVFVCVFFLAILLANQGPWLKAGEISDRMLESRGNPELPVGYKGAPVFGAKITWEAAIRPPFEEP